MSLSLASSSAWSSPSQLDRNLQRFSDQPALGDRDYPYKHINDLTPEEAEDLAKRLAAEMLKLIRDAEKDVLKAWTTYFRHNELPGLWVPNLHFYFGKDHSYHDSPWTAPTYLWPILKGFDCVRRDPDFDAKVCLYCKQMHEDKDWEKCANESCSYSRTFWPRAIKKKARVLFSSQTSSGKDGVEIKRPPTSSGESMDLKHLPASPGNSTTVEKKETGPPLSILQGAKDNESIALNVCRGCTYENSKESVACEICGTSMDLKHLPANPGNSTTVEKKETGPPLSILQGAKDNESIASNVCRGCTYVNPKESVVCEMCGTSIADDPISSQQTATPKSGSSDATPKKVTKSRRNNASNSTPRSPKTRSQTRALISKKKVGGSKKGGSTPAAKAVSSKGKGARGAKSVKKQADATRKTTKGDVTPVTRKTTKSDVTPAKGDVTPVTPVPRVTPKGDVTRVPPVPPKTTKSEVTPAKGDVPPVTSKTTKGDVTPVTPVPPKTTKSDVTPPKGDVTPVPPVSPKTTKSDVTPAKGDVTPVTPVAANKASVKRKGSISSDTSTTKRSRLEPGLEEPGVWTELPDLVDPSTSDCKMTKEMLDAYRKCTHSRKYHANKCFACCNLALWHYSTDNKCYCLNHKEMKLAGQQIIHVPCCDGLNQEAIDKCSFTNLIQRLYQRPLPAPVVNFHGPEFQSANFGIGCLYCTPVLFRLGCKIM